MKLALISATALFGAISCAAVYSVQETIESANAGTILRLDPGLDKLIPASAKIEKLASGFQFIEGPLWFPAGHLWFSDVPGNVVRQWSPDGKVIEILRPSGYDGNDAPPGALIGSNGMIADRDGAVLLCQHGNRRIVRIAKDRHVTTLIDRFEGKKLNSPNDLVYKSDGSLYFTDPPLRPCKAGRRSEKGTQFQRSLSALARQIASGDSRLDPPQRNRLFARRKNPLSFEFGRKAESVDAL